MGTQPMDRWTSGRLVLADPPAPEPYEAPEVMVICQWATEHAGSRRGVWIVSRGVDVLGAMYAGGYAMGVAGMTACDLLVLFELAGRRLRWPYPADYDLPDGISFDRETVLPAVAVLAEELARSGWIDPDTVTAVPITPAPIDPPTDVPFGEHTAPDPLTTREE